MISTKKCLICKQGQKNDCLHWHTNPDTGDIWVYCVGVCQRAYSIHDYCYKAGIPLNEFLKQDFTFQEARPNEVNAIEFPYWYVPLSDSRAKPGIEYLQSRGLSLDGDMYYDYNDNGLVFPYYYDNVFVGAQTRFIVPRMHKDGTIQKMNTIPGTRLGLLFYNWNQTQFMTHVKGIIITEGALNALSIQQSLNCCYGSVALNPWRVIACSGAGATYHHRTTLKELKDQGYKIVLAPDSDEAGLHMLSKFVKSDAITHYAFTNDSDHDWNDLLQQLGHKQFGVEFIKRIINVQRKTRHVKKNK